MGKISCFFCNRKCKGDVLKVGEKYFHKECFTCKVCHKKMETTGFFCKEDAFYCLDDYKKYCASICFSCSEKIIGEVVTALDHTFHKECFKCSICFKCFSPGDRVSMRMTEFLCTDCCAQPPFNKSGIENDIHNQLPINKKQLTENGFNHLNLSDIHPRDSEISTIPIRRKNVVDSFSSIERSLSNNPVESIKSPLNERVRDDKSFVDTELDHSVRNSQTPKHFHLPPGNYRSWSSSMGSKAHPLALSANNINRSLSNPSKIIENTMKSQEFAKRMSGYPSGDINIDQTEALIDGDDWPSPPALGVIMSERNRRKIQNPTVEALSSGTAPKIRKPRSSSQYTERECVSQNSTLNRLRLSEVLDKSVADSAPHTNVNDIQKKKSDIPNDPISASRTPSAVCEPLAPPRYDNHTETSPSRNDEYFRSSNRHLGYSMEYINSTNRSFISEINVPGYRRSLRNSNTDLLTEENNDFNGLKKTRVRSNVTDYKVVMRNNKYASDQLERETRSLGRLKTIPYEQLRVSTLKMIRNVNKTNLESYLSEEEFVKLFQLTKTAFYQLPEWKRNDLKKRVDLF